VNRPVQVFLAAGIATAPGFMEQFRRELHAKLEQVSGEVRSELVYPYGNWNRSFPLQLWEAGHDLRRGAAGYRVSYGGARLLDMIAAREAECDHPETPQTILVGHSAGGTAVIHAALKLMERGRSAPPAKVIMVGSPRFRIPDKLSNHVHYLYTAVPADMIARIGSFRGLRVRRQAPSAITKLPIVGGHADYFRNGDSFRNEDGRSNLQLTLNAVWTWLADRMHAGERTGGICSEVNRAASD